MFVNKDDVEGHFDIHWMSMFQRLIDRDSTQWLNETFLQYGEHECSVTTFYDSIEWLTLREDEMSIYFFFFSNEMKAKSVSNGAYHWELQENLLNWYIERPMNEVDENHWFGRERKSNPIWSGVVSSSERVKTLC